MAMNQEANTPVVLTIGAVSCFLILVIMFGVEAWFRYEERNILEDQWEQSRNTWLDNLRQPQKASLEAPAANGHSQIDNAMDLVIKNKGQLPATQPSASARAE